MASTTAHFITAVMLGFRTQTHGIAQVRAEGPGSVAVGQMSGGQILIGPTRGELKALLQSESSEQEARIRDAGTSRARTDQILVARLDRFLTDLPRLARGISASQMARYSESLMQQFYVRSPLVCAPARRHAGTQAP